MLIILVALSHCSPSAPILDLALLLKHKNNGDFDVWKTDFTICKTVK